MPMPRDQYEKIRKLKEVAEIARAYHAVNDDGHECPRDGSECDGCRLKDALEAVDR